MDGVAGADTVTDRLAGAGSRAHEIILGGQGIKVISSLLAQAAHEAGRHAMMYNIYAAAIRGGPIFCTVLVADRGGGRVLVGLGSVWFGASGDEWPGGTFGSSRLTW
jgi:hypothetical protein